MTTITITVPIEERDSELERLREGERLREENERLKQALDAVRKWEALRHRNPADSTSWRIADAALTANTEPCIWTLPREAGIFYSSCGEEGMGFPPDDGDICRGCGKVIAIRIAAGGE